MPNLGEDSVSSISVQYSTALSKLFRGSSVAERPASDRVGAGRRSRGVLRMGTDTFIRPAGDFRQPFPARFRRALGCDRTSHQGRCTALPVVGRRKALARPMNGCRPNNRPPWKGLQRQSVPCPIALGTRLTCLASCSHRFEIRPVLGR